MRVYVAGAFSADNVLQVLENMRLGMNLATRLFALGFAPFAPWHDFHFALMREDHEEMTVETFYRYSMEWLEVSQAVLLVPGWHNSKGTLAEIERAAELGIPIFTTIDQLLRHRSRACGASDA